MSAHRSVLLHESVEALAIREDGWYLDATFGRGGHSRLILSQLGSEGRLYAIDRDPQAAKEVEGIDDPRFHFAYQPFSVMPQAFAEVGAASLDGVLFDLGVSSPQLDQAERGFSFQKDGPLDMRMDNQNGLTAQEWLAEVSEAELSKTIRDLGGETHSIAKRIAKAIIAKRDKLRGTLDLAEVVAEAMPKKYHRPGYHPATQTFQAIRMAVNDEVGEIERGLAAATKLLKSGGVLAVITFHGLEDALVKRFIRSKEGHNLPAEIPSSAGRVGAELRLVRPVIKPSQSEVADNPRCRSARLRKAVKI
ncbi:16S rRNA (cytosine(1402)-N(4))-methyltransferase RsmH [Suttonella sp. R2A3]|uniref:16S rRNA (cytosine(1402)-N(4))-methyltransferase RsmH n=1 Tax=Suttonella sp. R2A3 TaxID=2908648 RepID=UPI001F2AAF45|nr:16S rRNA (cytosine(1402)-N(4))-methyltransferase RsmH [Suttonella sp. R2A3]UJF24606.1 16S rRNA (cytosine(1402)-N(4))-methyltransferase RsmH [Suttonella sp. R2A3]